MSYTAPISDLLFVLEEIAGIGEIAQLPGYGDATRDLVQSVLDEAGKFAAGVLAPLNRIGDEQGVHLDNGIVRTAEGFRDAYSKFVGAGWNAVPFDPDYGGQGLPWALAAATQEMMTSANMAFALCPLLTQGAVELLQAHGSAEQKRIYLPNLVHGRWSGTMNLTEPQAGTDIGAVRTRAMKDGDRYRITGQKIFITYGEHDMSENIVHMVLARTPGAPPGIKGVSLFIVPKFGVRADGTLDGRNDLRCVALEHKLGIHGSPTAVMAYGDNDGAIGELVGEENRGIEYMFTMMNNARLSIGIEGLAIAERAYQQARDYALTRIQGRAADGSDPAPVPIIRHPDVRRMLMTMRAQTEAMRALIAYTAGALDRAKRHPDAAERTRRQTMVDLLIPVAKAWCTDTGCAVTSMGIQVHGGLGFIESTGAAQHFRDARITPIYEGTNGIQAIDLVGRKLARDGGAAVGACIGEMRAVKSALEDDEIRDQLGTGIDHLARATDWIVTTWPADKPRALAAATPYLSLFGTVAGGWLMAKAVLAARRGTGDNKFLSAKTIVAQFYATNILPQAAGLADVVCRGGGDVLALEEQAF